MRVNDFCRLAHGRVLAGAHLDGDGVEVASRAWSFLTVAVLSCVVRDPAVPGKLFG